ncbi:MAG: hypothetical protein QM572_01985 [Nocardioides sp.]|uniref:hypothetical protein n=1 Tax=Nocardioides sp. TaxID=35761 RepID=UPI0039E39DF7
MTPWSAKAPFPSSSLAALRNSGLVELRGSSGPRWRDRDARTLIVVGVPRSGTTMVATALVRLGVPMGELNEDVYEDLETAAALEQGEVALLPLIERRNQAHRVWGFKRPEAFTALDPARIGIFRRPRVLATFRDPVAIAERNRISVHQDFMAGLRRAVRETRRLVQWLGLLPCPVFVISYEKALGSPEELIDGLVSFCGLTPTAEQRAAAIDSVQNGTSAYLDASRIPETPAATGGTCPPVAAESWRP